MRVSEALAVEIRHFTNDGRTINIEQQVEKDSPRIVKYLKTAAAKRQVDLHPDIAEYLQRYAAGKSDLLFHTSNGTPHLYGNLEDRWLTPRLTKMGLDEEGRADTHLSVSVKPGCAVAAAWKTSTISGWPTSRNLCPNSIHTFTRNCKCASMRLNE